MSKWVTCLWWSAALLAVAAAANDPTDCSSKPPILDSATGSLKIKSNETLAGKTCEWVIDTSKETKGAFIHLDLQEELMLGPDDWLNVTNEANKNETLYSSKGYLSPGVILIGSKYPKITVTIKFVAEPTNKGANIDIDYKFGANDKMTIQVQNIADTGCFVFPHPSVDQIDLGLDKVGFSITLMTKSKMNNLLINLGAWDLNGGDVTLDKVDKYKNTDKFDDKTKPEFILSTDNQVNIKINDLKIDPKSWKGINLHYELVDSFCTQYLPVDKKDLDKAGETINFKQPDPSNLTSLSNFRCLNIFEINEPTAKFLFDLRNFTFPNTGDLITVLDGMSRDSTTLALIESRYMDEYWKQVYLYTATNKIWIMYESRQLINRTPPKGNDFGVRPLSQGGTFQFNATWNSTDLVMDEKKKTPTPIVLVYTADPQKQIVIDFDEKTVLPGTGPLIGISDNSMQSGQPFIKMNGGEYPPDLIASNGFQLKIEIYQNLNLKDIKVRVVDKGCHSSVIDTSGASYSLTGCNELCSWLIPKRDNSNGTYVAQFSRLNLSLATDEISMERLSSKNSVFKLKGPLLTTTFPNLILDASETYVMYTRRTPCPKDVDKGSQVLAASLVYENDDQTTNSISISNDDNKVLKTSTYPNYYSIGLDHTFRVGKSNVNDTIKALITFTDLDLIPGHQLLFWSQPMKDPTPINTKLSDVSDLLVDFPLMLNLSSQSIVSSSPPFSARGFSANLSAIRCGEAFKVEKDKPVKISTPASLKDIKKCVWTLTTDNLNATYVNVLNVTIDQGKDKFDLTKLKFYDSNSLRDSHRVMNFSYFVNNTFILSSTNSLVIEYVSDKDLIPLNLTVTQGACVQMCWSAMRCSLEQFHCNGFDDCGDWSDENCNNGTRPSPGPQPQPGPNITYTSGVNGWVVTLVICPLMIGLGVLGTIFGPTLMRRFGRGRYREFQDFSEVS